LHRSSRSSFFGSLIHTQQGKNTMVASVNNQSLTSVQTPQTGLLNRIDSASSGAKPLLTRQTALSSRVDGVASRGRLAQNVMEGGTAFGYGNAQIRTNTTTGGVVLCTASHTLIHPSLGVKPRLPTVIQVNGDTPTPIASVFSDPSKVKMFEALSPNGKPMDMVRIGTPKDLEAYFTQLAKVQPTVAELRNSFSKPNAVWDVNTASRPQSYDPAIKTPVAPAEQSDRSETTGTFNIKMAALPLQVKDIAQDMKALGMKGLQDKPDSWLAIQAVGGDQNNLSSPYKNLYLINKGVSGSEAKPGGLKALDSGNVRAGIDMRDADIGWNLKNVTQLVVANKPLRVALQTKFPTLSVSELASTLHRSGFTAIGFISKESAVSNLARIQDKEAQTPFITPGLSTRD
jgi:hypothetical protein